MSEAALLARGPPAPRPAVRLRRPPPAGPWLGWAAAAVPLSLAGTDLLRLITPGQSIYFSLGPALVVLATLAALVLRGRLARPPTALLLAAAAQGLLCLHGALVSLFEGIPSRQILAGGLAQAGYVPALFLGFALGRSDRDWQAFVPWVGRLVAFSLGVAFLQQFGLARQSATLEGYHDVRGVVDIGATFTYTTGPFRTADVFGFFLVCSALLLVQGLGERIAAGRPRALPWALLLSLALFAATLLAARRSVLGMLFCVVLPFLFLLRRRLNWAVKVTLAIVAAILWLVIPSAPAQGDVPGELEAKFQHSFLHVDAEARLSHALMYTDHDARIVTFAGHGLGSHGPGARVSAETEAEDFRFITRYYRLHYGWYQMLVMFGPVGLFLQLACAASLIAATAPAWRSLAALRLPFALSGLGLAFAVFFIFFLASTSYLTSLSGGPLFGLALGAHLGRVTPALGRALRALPRGCGTSLREVPFMAFGGGAASGGAPRPGPRPRVRGP